MNDYGVTGRIITADPYDWPMPKWVNYRPIKHGIRYNLEALKTTRRDNKAHSKKRKR